MSKDFEFIINEDSERAELFKQVLGRLNVYIESPLPKFAQLGVNDTPEEVYMLDLELLTPDERTALVNTVANKFNADPVAVDAQLNQLGMPIQAQDGIVMISNPQKWLD